MINLKCKVGDSSVPEFKDCIIEWKLAQNQYLTQYVNVGIPIEVYTQLGNALSRIDSKRTLDRTDRVRTTEKHVITAINIRNKSTEGLMKFMSPGATKDDVTEYILPDLATTLGNLKTSISCALIVNIRFKRQAKKSYLSSIPFTIGLTFRSIIIKGTIDLPDTASQLEDDEKADPIADADLVTLFHDMMNSDSESDSWDSEKSAKSGES